MPIPQEKLVGLLKAAVAYRQSLENLNEFLLMEHQTHSIPPSAIPYVNGIRQRIQYESHELALAHKVNIDLALQIYTPARVKRNEKMKLNQRIRRTGSPILPPRDTIPIDGPSIYNLPDANTLPANVTQEDIDEIVRKFQQKGR